MRNTNYLINGFSLTNKALDILLIGVLLSLSAFIPYFLPRSLAKISIALMLINFLVVFIDFGFRMSIPVFLVNKQKNKPLKYKYLRNTVLHNAKRMLLPGFLLILLMAVIVFVLFVIAIIVLAMNSGGDSKQMISAIQNLPNSIKGWNLASSILAGLLSFFVFIPIYFSIENYGIVGSMKRSVVFGFKNLNYMSLVILVSVISSYLFGLLPISFDDTYGVLGLLTKTVLGDYLGLIITASSLLYYQSKVSKKAERRWKAGRKDL